MPLLMQRDVPKIMLADTSRKNGLDIQRPI